MTKKENTQFIELTQKELKTVSGGDGVLYDLGYFLGQTFAEIVEVVEDILDDDDC